jgi:hypothetical protein
MFDLLSLFFMNPSFEHASFTSLVIESRALTHATLQLCCLKSCESHPVICCSYTLLQLPETLSTRGTKSMRETASACINAGSASSASVDAVMRILVEVSVLR